MEENPAISQKRKGVPGRHTEGREGSEPESSQMPFASSSALSRAGVRPQPRAVYLQRNDAEEPEAGVLHELPHQHQDAAGCKGEGRGSGDRGHSPGPPRSGSPTACPQAESIFWESRGRHGPHTRVHWSLLIKNTGPESGSLAYSQSLSIRKKLNCGASGQAGKCKSRPCPLTCERERCRRKMASRGGRQTQGRRSCTGV